MRIDYQRITQEMYEPRTDEISPADRALLVASVVLAVGAVGTILLFWAIDAYLWPALAGSLAQTFVDTLGVFRRS